MIQFLNKGGINTLDATAQSNDIISKKTAYVKNTKITGNIKLNNKSSEDVSTTTITISNDNIITKSDNTKTLSIYNKTPMRQAYESNSYVGTGCSYEDLANYIELTPEKLVQGNSVLGVEGTTSTGGFDTSQIRQCDYMFANNTDIIEAPKFDTNKIVSMSHMFNNCTSLKKIPHYNSDSLINASHMFDGCINLDDTGETEFHYYTLEDASYMFCNCKSLQYVPQICETTNLIDTSYMFYGCESLRGTTRIFTIDMSSVINAKSMFEDCINFNEIINIMENTINTNSMYKNCSSLSDYVFNGNEQIVDMGSMFEGCTKLRTINEYFSAFQATNMSNMFFNCPSLESFDNILYGCITAEQIAPENKTLKYIGLSQEQAEICKTLSNYQAFLDAGWTTGY